MDSAHRRACAGAVAATLVGFGALWASPAQAATCQSLPGSTIGTDVTVAGEEQRVPAISGITICVDTPVVPLLTVSTSGNGNCTSGCLSVLTTGGDIDSGSVTVSYKADGVTRSQTVSGGSLGGPSGSCLFSVGSPDAPYPTCFVALGPDEIPDPGPLPDPGPTVDDLEEDVDDAVDGLPDAGSIAAETVDLILDTVPDDPVGEVPVEQACALIPTARDQWGNVVSFCDDPALWATSTVENTVDKAEDEVEDAQANACNRIPDESDENGSADFCENPARWLAVLLQSTFHPVISECERIDCATLPDRVVEVVCEIRNTPACR